MQLAKLRTIGLTFFIRRYFSITPELNLKFSFIFMCSICFVAHADRSQIVQPQFSNIFETMITLVILTTY